MQGGRTVRHMRTKQLPCCRYQPIRLDHRRVAPARRSKAVPRTVELSDGVVNSVDADDLDICARHPKSFMTVASPESRRAHGTGPTGAVQIGDPGRLPRTVELSDVVVNSVHTVRHRMLAAGSGAIMTDASRKTHTRRAGSRPCRVETAATVRDDDFEFSEADRAPARR